ncbi:hypothetical protein Syun_030037 [Stephania yunnanensis]|uniref:Uncharacterized protein n=1 Tax=Stephania yunnanensis TaxID=152371 RepID=A0AAP0HGL2_9MAGN
MLGSTSYGEIGPLPEREKGKISGCTVGARHGRGIGKVQPYFFLPSQPRRSSLPECSYFSS